jgi:hypothetical protein
MTKTRRKRKMEAWSVAMLVVALCSTGCLQPSLNPLFLPQDAAFDERLLGTWVCQDETWTFARTTDDDWKSHEVYTVTIQTTDTTSELLAWLGRLDDAVFVTFTPKSEPHPAARFLGRHVISVYTFGRIVIEPMRLRLAMLDADWIETAETAGLLTIGVKREEPRADVLLTAKAVDLQRFARAYSGDDHVFGERLEFVRPAMPAPTPTESTVRPAGTCYAEK